MKGTEVLKLFLETIVSNDKNTRRLDISNGTERFRTLDEDWTYLVVEREHCVVYV